MLAKYDRNGQKYTFTQNSSNKTMINPISPSVLMGHQVATVPRLVVFWPFAAWPSGAWQYVMILIQLYFSGTQLSEESCGMPNPGAVQIKLRYKNDSNYHLKLII